MPAKPRPVALSAGQIVLVDWRADALPKEPNKRRPAVVIEDDRLFAPAYPNVLVVPLTADEGLVLPSLAVRIDPGQENGCTKPSWAAAHLVTAASKQRVTPTPSRITEAQLAEIRLLVGFAIGIEP